LSWDLALIIQYIHIFKGLPHKMNIYTFCPYTGDIFAIKNEMTAYVFKNYLQDFFTNDFHGLLYTFAFYFPFSSQFTFLTFFSFFLVKLSAPYEFFMICTIS
jgi:hypothetical protein